MDRHLAGFDLRQVEDLVDQLEEIVARRVDGLGELHLLAREVSVAVLGERLRQDEQAVERRPELVGHVREELALVFRDELELLRLLFEASRRELHLLVLQLEQLRLVVQLGGLRLELRVRLLELLEELLGAHARGDHVQDDADRRHQLIEEREVVRREVAERRELDDSLGLALEEHREDDHRARRGLAHAGRDRR